MVPPPPHHVGSNHDPCGLWADRRASPAGVTAVEVPKTLSGQREQAHEIGGGCEKLRVLGVWLGSTAHKVSEQWRSTRVLSVGDDTARGTPG